MLMTKQRFTTRDMIERLISFDTTSSKSNLELIDFADNYLTAHGAVTRRTCNSEGNKANLFATLGPEIAGGVVLSGHTDVVPVEGQAWDSDPFQVVEKDQRLYGRGTSDMKSFLACALAMVPDFLARPLNKPIHLALSYDEEIGCYGAVDLIKDIATSLPLPRMVIVGEPTSMQIVNGHKGSYTFNTRVLGKEAHSSQPHHGGNAVFAAADLIHFLSGMAAERRAGAPADCPFEPPYTTVHVGLVNGGTALNIIPRECSFSWEIRAIPEDDFETLITKFNNYAETDVLPRLREFAPEAAIMTTREAQVPPLAPEKDGPAEALIRLLTGANHTAVVSFGTEGGLFQQAGMSTVICGPGSIDQAHKPNEYIDYDQITACENLLGKLGDWAAAD